jgi:hypothetical protein
LERCIIRENTGGYCGGGVDASGINSVDVDGTTTIRDCDISHNSATMGGGVCATRGTTLLVQSSNVTSNEASQYGGGVYVAQSSFVSFAHGRIHGNTAVVSGGGCYMTGADSELQLVSTATTNNVVRQADGGGGGARTLTT